MATITPPRNDFTTLDRQIAGALDDLRSARTAATRAGNRANVDRRTRAEEHLDALLEYRHAASRR